MQLPRSSYSDLEPVESFVIGPSAADGIYKVIVRRASGPSALTLNASGATGRFFDGATPRSAFGAPACTAANPYWHVANITKSGTSYMVSLVNSCHSIVP